ncbi:hypothetical protein [Streptococcus caballi]|uniref:hypothetical protein n=1 Tax=Streptococcus caballi TaxID=439220 RepID=UPI00035D3134|nr:hypothetical protein [Streptococcus caballi]
MTEQELIKGYETEIQYQKHMIENLGRWFSLFFIIASSGVVLTYFFKGSQLALFILGIVLLVLGILGMLLFGYGIYKGKQNVNKVIDDFETKLHSAKA